MDRALLEAAIALRRDVPSRSTATLIHILQTAGRIVPGQLRRSTLDRHLAAAGMARRRLRTLGDKRYLRLLFERPNQFWVGDYHEAPLLWDPAHQRFRTLHLRAVEEIFGRALWEPPHPEIVDQQRDRRGVSQVRLTGALELGVGEPPSPPKRQNAGDRKPWRTPRRPRLLPYDRRTGRGQDVPSPPRWDPRCPRARTHAWTAPLTVRRSPGHCPDRRSAAWPYRISCCARFRCHARILTPTSPPASWPRPTSAPGAAAPRAPAELLRLPPRQGRPPPGACGLRGRGRGGPTHPPLSPHFATRVAQRGTFGHEKLAGRFGHDAPNRPELLDGVGVSEGI